MTVTFGILILVWNCSCQSSWFWHALNVLFNVICHSDFFHVFLKFNRGMPAVSSMTTPLLVYMFRIWSIVILVLTINSLKMKQMFDVFVLQ